MPTEQERLAQAERAIAFVEEFHGDPRCALNCLNSEALVDEVKRLRARLAEAKTPTWQPMETAPLDGTAVLLTEEDEGEPVTGAYVDFNGEPPSDYHSGWFDRISGEHEIHPTHWMPLPSPPPSAPSDTQGKA